MAAMSREGLAVLVFSGFVCVFLAAGQASGALLCQLFFGGLLALAALTYLISLLQKVQRNVSQQQHQQQQPHTEINHDELQSRARDALLHDHITKADSYNDRILRPRNEAKRKQKEDDFRRHMGPAWKGQGHISGTEDGREERSPRLPPGSSTSSHAARRRKLPETEAPEPPEVTSSTISVHAEVEQMRPKQVIELPPEPSEGSAGHVTVQLRTPQGRFYQRRFDTNNTVQVLYDYMTTIGYHHTLYTLITSYPRHSLEDATERTLTEAQITGRITLNVDRRDPD